jgi:tetratricopeptide (TPR) repeat protein
MVLFLLLPLFSTAKQEDALFNEANRLYKEQNYEVAIALYDSILKAGYASPELYFNLGNAYFKTGNLAPAILNYERAKKLAPADEDIDFNLRIANLRVVDRVEAVPELFFVRWAKNLVIHFSSDGWATLALILFLVTFIVGAIFLFLKHYLLKRLAFFVALIFLLLSITSAIIAYSQYNYQRESSAGIVFAKNVYVKSSPDAQSTNLFMLHEGIKISLIGADGEWQKIQLADGKVGWMLKSGLQEI